MKVTIIKGDEITADDLAITDIRSCLSLLKMRYGQRFTDELLENSYKFILRDNSEKLSPIALTPEVITSDMAAYDELYIIQDLGGEVPAAALVGVMGLGSTGAIFAAAAINLALSFALNMVMSALSPTNTFDSDPSANQKTSNLFNGGVATTEAGGSVPYLFGNFYGSAGVVISASVETTEG